MTSVVPSIRKIATLSTGALVVAVALVVSALIWTSTQLQTSMETVIRDTKSQEITSELEVSLLIYQRLSNLRALTGEEPTPAIADLEVRMRGLLDRAFELTSSSDERQLLERIDENLNRYLAERKRLSERRFDLEEAVRRTRPLLNETIMTLDALRQLNETQVDRTDARMVQVTRLSRVAGVSAAALLLIGLLGVTFGVRPYLLRPILALHGTIKRFESGDVEARADGGGLREIAELTAGFNDMAETLARQREKQLTFLAGVAHDLRNPLSGLKLGLHALEQEQSELRRTRTRTMLDRQVDRLGRMIEDLLDAARIEAGELDLKPEDLDLRDVVEDMVRLYAPTSPDHEILSDISPTPVVIHGDALRMEQVVSNLLSNALKFSPRGGPISIAVGSEGACATISIADQGIGIPREEIPHIFLPFRRRKPDVAPGAGLGLSVVRRIVTAHGGEIDVESEPGAGSTFRIRLPRVLDEPTTTFESRPRRATSSSTRDLPN